MIRPGSPSWGGSLSTIDLLVLTSKDQSFLLKILFVLYTNQLSLLRRSTVLSLTIQLVFLDQDNRLIHLIVYSLQFTVYSLQCTGYRLQFTVDTLQLTLYSWHFTVYSLQFTVYKIQFTVYSLQFTDYSLLFTVYSLQFTVYSLQFTVYSLQITVYCLQFTVYSLQFTVYSWHFTVDTLQLTLYSWHFTVLWICTQVPYSHDFIFVLTSNKLECYITQGWRS